MSFDLYNYPEASTSLKAASSASTSSLVLMDPYTSSPRQSPFIETPTQRRSRYRFLEQEKEKDTSRIASWVQSQVENSALMISLAQMAAAGHGRDRSSRRHRRPEPQPRIAECHFTSQYCGSEYELEDTFYSPIPLSQPKARSRYHNPSLTPHFSSSYSTPVVSLKSSRRRRSRWTNPNLATIPELEE
ncbi:hypothetical protein Moror_6737 [Moniliophthora roreri MCA 2997]|uniref:Uncharacterized protein n=2 Tax=Moniliophthora roreri TaxID=221103 RepID=V2XW04_MONRO|nr:hypothetical protein Moror_6737 [Moniliophthora roreri MCA 2997]